MSMGGGCRGFLHMVHGNPGARGLMRPFLALSRSNLGWTVVPRALQNPGWNVHDFGGTCEFQCNTANSTVVVVQGWRMIQRREINVSGQKKLVVVFRRRFATGPDRSVMVTTFNEWGTHGSMILDLGEDIPCCITSSGNLLVACVPKGVASTDRTVLRLFTRKYVDQEHKKEIQALGVMEGSVRALCENDGVVLCLARLNKSTNGRLILISMSGKGQRHRCWDPKINNLVGMEPTSTGAGVLLVDRTGKRWGVPSCK